MKRKVVPTFAQNYCALLLWREEILDYWFTPCETCTKEYYQTSKDVSIPYCLQLELAVNKFFASCGSDLRVGFDKSTYRFLATTP